MQMRNIFLGLVTIGLLSILALVGVGFWALQPMTQSGAATQAFVIPKGQAVAVIAQRLTEQKLIRHPLVFRVVVWRLQLAKKLQAGTFDLSPSQTPMQIATQLTQGTNDQWITIKEGWRREEIADALATQIEDFDRAGFLAASEGWEGQLFPDTYLVPKHMTAEELVTLLTDTYQKKISIPNQALLKQQQRSEAEVLTLASLIEREARGNAQQKIVANILYHRLEIGMPLQVDATLQYAHGSDGTNWWVPPLAVDRQRPSSYNTYLKPGLPPTPICSPGVGAFLAALQPEPTTDLFYVHDSEGVIHSAKTLEEHNANIAKYLR